MRTLLLTGCAGLFFGCSQEGAPMAQKKTMAFESILSNINQNGVTVSEFEETVRVLEGLANDGSIEAAYVLGRA